MRVCGRLLLAWLPAAFPQAEIPPGVLGREDRTQQGAGPAGGAGVARGGLEGAARLGARAEEAGAAAGAPAQGAGQGAGMKADGVLSSLRRSLLL